MQQMQRIRAGNMENLTVWVRRRADDGRSVWREGDGMISYCAGLLVLALLAQEDIRRKELSANKLFLFGALALLYLLLSGQFIPGELPGRLLPGLALLFLSWLTGEAIGYGDGMAVMVLGLWTDGWFAALTVWIGIMLAGAFGAVCLVRKKRELMIPFVPFLLLGMEVVLYYA